MPNFSRTPQTNWQKKLSNYTPMLAIVLGFGFLGTYLLTSSQAATPTSSIQPEVILSNVAAPVTTVTDVTASGSGAVKFTSQAAPQPPSSGWPDATNTGYKNAPDYPGSLHTCTTPIQSNTVYNFCDFPSGLSVGSSSTAVSNVTFHGCHVHAVAPDDALVVLFGDNITFDYCSFTPNVAAPLVPNGQSYQYGIEAGGGYNSHVGKFTVTHSDFWGFGNAIDATGSTQAKPHVYRDNYFHDACFNNSTCGGSYNGSPCNGQSACIYHTDGIGNLNSGGQSYVVIDHNTIVSQGNTNGLAFQYGPYDHFTITNNYFSGFGQMINVGGGSGPSNTVFTDNTWGTDIQQSYNAWYSWSGTGNTWRRNKIHYVNPIRWQGDNPNSYVFKSSDDGKFWTPSGVSTTDYTGQ